jgi:hypothetical protein
MIGHKLLNKTKSATVAELKLFHQLNNLFIEELPWWVGVGRGLTPHAPCAQAQRLFPGRAARLWVGPGVNVLGHRFAGRSRRGQVAWNLGDVRIWDAGCVKRRQLVKPPSSRASDNTLAALSCDALPASTLAHNVHARPIHEPNTHNTKYLIWVINVGCPVFQNQPNCLMTK